MTPISAPKKRLQKPKYAKGEAKLKLLRFDPPDLALIERAAKSLNPPPTSSYYIVRAAVERARYDLRLPQVPPS
jgi:hypothetical protein